MSKLPEGWLSLELGEVVEYADNESVDPDRMPPDAWLLELEDIERDSSRILDRKTVGERKPRSAKNRFDCGNVLYGKLRPYLNKVVRADRAGYCSSEIIAISPGLLDAGYLFYSLRSPAFTNYVASVSHGMRMPRLGTQQAKAAPFLLPPAAEQKRVAQKLDALLAQVDALKARIDAIHALIKRFRRSVLSAATTGKLTQDLRDPSDDAWMETTIGDVCASSFYGPRFGKDEYTTAAEGIPTIRTTDMTDDGKIVVSCNTPRVLVPKDKIEKFRVEKGDLLITRTGSIGVMAVFEGDYESIPSAYLIRFRFKREISSRYAFFCLMSPAGQAAMGLSATAITQPNINAESIKSISIQLPSTEEQIEIVRQVEQLFAFADQLEAKVAAAKQRIDMLTQSILAKAFRGELVPQDPNDEPATVLLGRIRARRAATPKARSGRKPVSST